MRPFTTQWKTFVADATAKDPKRRTADERAAIELAQREWNKPDEFRFRTTLGALLDCTDYLEAMKHGEVRQLSPDELEAAGAMLTHAQTTIARLLSWIDCDSDILDVTERKAVLAFLQHQALTRENDNG